MLQLLLLLLLLQARHTSYYPINSVKWLKKWFIYICWITHPFNGPFLGLPRWTSTHTHTHPFNGPFPGLPRWAGTRKVKPIWILLKQETVSGSGISWATCKSAPLSRQITMPAPRHSVFLQAGCPSCRPTNSVKALKALALKALCIYKYAGLLGHKFYSCVRATVDIKYPLIFLLLWLWQTKFISAYYVCIELPVNGKDKNFVYGIQIYSHNATWVYKYSGPLSCITHTRLDQVTRKETPEQTENSNKNEPSGDFRFLDEGVPTPGDGESFFDTTTSELFRNSNSSWSGSCELRLLPFVSD